MATVSGGGALVTDWYELNMAVSYLRRGMTAPATFSLFVRKLPPTRGFLVVAGLEDCLAYLESFAFQPAELQWLREQGLDAATVDALGGLRFTGDVHAVPEGRVVLADEPILEVTAPIAEAQLVETYLLNQVTFQTALATKAARCSMAAGPIELVDFALRRTHGTEAGMAVARLSAMAGFVGTSNVEAARRFGLRPSGTMAHSFVEAFESESAAFRAFAEDHSPPLTFLVDTYDTLGGVEAAIAVITDLGLSGPLAVRLDSGDLDSLARATRARLDQAGLPDVRIFVSGGLDERDLRRFVAEGVPVDAAGVGTRMGVSVDAPTLDSAYKLVAFGDRPVMKLSTGKRTWPGAKQVWRRPGAIDDVLALRSEAGPAGREPLLVPVMRRGERVAAPATIDEGRVRLDADLASLPETARDLEHPVAPAAQVSPALEALATQLARSLSGRTGR